MTIYLTTVGSPLGDLVIAAHESAVSVLEFIDEWPAAERRLFGRAVLTPSNVAIRPTPLDW